MAADWVEVYSTTEPMEAELLKGLLETNQIPVLIQARGQKALGFIFGSAAVGEFLLKVPPDLADLAGELLAAQFEEAEPTEE